MEKKLSILVSSFDLFYLKNDVLKEKILFEIAFLLLPDVGQFPSKNFFGNFNKIIFSFPPSLGAKHLNDIWGLFNYQRQRIYFLN